VVTGARHDPIGYDFRAEILGSQDSLVVGVDGRTPIHSVQPDAPPAPADPYRGFLDRFRQAFTDETAAFVDLVLGRGPNHCPPEAALSALRVAVACETSWRERRAVELMEVADVA
jgi:myo-inositol 2-dehydrogenase / D-chiro-inositol 1-dehydrogenase